VTHVYFGAANRSPMREQLRAGVAPVYDVDGVTIYAITLPSQNRKAMAAAYGANLFMRASLPTR
ncbi:MAG TPA: hypothetical protein VMU84_04460, partial [Thermoanaerobaculia bacterium]|nr:hypothetical protein [Thermoanaerobaculia bacterium]